MDEYPYDHGAEVNLNGGAPITVGDAYECWQKCQLDAYYPQGDGFTGCEYAVYAQGQCCAASTCSDAKAARRAPD